MEKAKKAKVIKLTQKLKKDIKFYPNSQRNLKKIIDRQEELLEVYEDMLDDSEEKIYNLEEQIKELKLENEKYGESYLSMIYNRDKWRERVRQYTKKYNNEIINDKDN